MINYIGCYGTGSHGFNCFNMNDLSVKSHEHKYVMSHETGDFTLQLQPGNIGILVK